MSYHRNIHYNSVVNPNKATIGVGLGLPAFKPGVTTTNTLPDFSEASLCIVGAVVHASKQRSVFKSNMIFCAFNIKRFFVGPSMPSSR